MILSSYKGSYHLSADFFSKSSDYKKTKKTSENVAEICGSNVRRIKGQVLGVVGLNEIGSLVAVRAKVFGFTVVAFDLGVNKGLADIIGVKMCGSLEVSSSQNVSNTFFLVVCDIQDHQHSIHQVPFTRSLSHEAIFTFS